MDVYELISDYFDDIYPHDSYAQDIACIKRDVLRRTNCESPGKKIRVLDICTGTGRALRVFDSDDTFELTGIDVSPKLIAKARDNYKNIRFIKCDALQLADAFDEEQFDCILMLGKSLQLFAPQERRTIFSQVQRFLCVGGTFYFDVFLDVLENREGVIKSDIPRSNEDILVTYRREPTVPPAPWKQHVDLFRREIESTKWTWQTATEYIYNVTLDEIRKEIESTELELTIFQLKRKQTIYLMAVKDAES